jgi:simple sugar transport system ATP-binding protein
MDKITIEEMGKIGINIASDPTQLVGTMSGGQRQTLAIARAIYFGAKVLNISMNLLQHLVKSSKWKF